jgi:alanine racemase
MPHAVNTTMPNGENAAPDLVCAPMPESASGTLSIDLGAVIANWRRLGLEASGAECASVVKADAYGTGLERVGAALATAGCRTFFVAVPSEGVRLRAVVPQAAIYVLNGLATGQGHLYLNHRLRPVLGSREEIAEWQAVCRETGLAGEAALHVDTGMKRLGLSLADFAGLMSERKRAPLGFPPTLLVSHFVMSDNAGHPLNPRQMLSFEEARACAPDIPASIANSSGIFLGRRARHDCVRAGYALFGGNPTPGRENPMRSVVTLTVPIAQIGTVESGETIGYDAQWTARRRLRVATLSAGYADGYPRGATATDAKREAGIPAGEAIIAGRRCPFVGRVSMDLITVDVTAVPEGEVRRGDPATLVGEGLRIDEVGQRAGTIGYEILTRLGRRYERRYVE